ncbi:helix-turn-helix domain-containing protein [Laspinema sp. D1]|uniref:Helix-turn-helix domain-containing protein n=1 Tax=Laspinema palackyanum D2a TaxID=2953684 RepID=A0ABT2N0T1_9CYAN|nr:helix-turn-helix domain-containing protein [Laspinema sp. D2a]
MVNSRDLRQGNLVTPLPERHPRDLYYATQYSHEELAVLYGVTRETITRWLTGKHIPPRSMQITTALLWNHLGLDK